MKALAGGLAAAVVALLLGMAGLWMKLSNTELKLTQEQRDRQTERAAAATRLAEETDKVLEKERQLAELRDQQEKKDAANQTTIGRLRADLHGLSRAGGGGGLRDPHAAACDAAPGSTSAGAEPGAADRAEAGRLVSAPLEDLLLELVAEADAINIAYTSCRADSSAVRIPLQNQPP